MVHLGVGSSDDLVVHHALERMAWWIGQTGEWGGKRSSLQVCADNRWQTECLYCGPHGPYTLDSWGGEPVSLWALRRGSLGTEVWGGR